jgi:hypothetical protein
VCCTFGASCLDRLPLPLASSPSTVNKARNQKKKNNQNKETRNQSVL